LTDVFISYAREDRAIVQRLHDALTKAGREAWVDWEGIPASARWMAEVRAAIDEADCFCFVVSPDSIESPVCREEAEHAAASNKRILPLLHREVADGLVPETVAAHNWIEFDGRADFDAAFTTLVAALETEPEHLRTHTRLLVRAKEWEGSGRDRSRLLRGADLTAAEAWLAATSGKEPAPTQLQTAYVLASRKAASRRQRMTVGGVAIASVISLVLATVAVIQRGQAQEAQTRAEAQAAESRSRELGALSLLQVSDDPELALLLAVKAAEVAETTTAETALRTAIAGSHLEAAVAEAGSVSALALAPHGSTLVVGGKETRGDFQAAWLAIRPSANPGDPEHVVDLASSGADVGDIAIDPNGQVVAAATDVGTVVIVDMRSGEVVREASFPGVVFGNAALAFDPEGGRLLVAGEAGASWVDPESWQTVASVRVPGSDQGWDDVAIDPTGRWAVLAGGSGTYILDLTGGRDPVRLSRASAGSLSFDQSGERLAGQVGGAAVVWDVGRGAQVRKVEAGTVTAVALSPDGSALLSGGDDGQAALWNIATGSQIASLTGHTDWVTGAAFDPSGTRAFTIGADGSTRAWRVPSETVPITDEPVLSISDDGTVIAAGSAQRVTFDDAINGAPRSSVPPGDLDIVATGCLGSTDTVRPDVGLSSSGTTAVARLGMGCLLALDVRTGKPVWSQDLLEGSDQGAHPNAKVWISSDGEEVLLALHVEAGAPIAQLRLLDSGTGDEVWKEVTGTGLVYGADFSADGRHLYVAGRYGLLGAAVYDPVEGTTTCTAEASDRVNDVTAVPGSGFALATQAGVQVFNDRCTEVDVGELSERNAPALAIAFRPDGSLAATIGNDATVRLWDMSSGDQLGSLPATEDQLAFAEGNDIVLGGASGARRYACDLCGSFEELLKLARERTTRELTQQEEDLYLS
jgi:WD40 repeat protein